MKLFVYGSLKKGFFNHDRFGFGTAAKFLGEGTAKGVALVRVGNLPYPHAFRSNSGVVKGELYELTDETIASRLEDMEIGAGYTQHNVNVNGEDAVMYVAAGWSERAVEQALSNGAKIISEWKEEV